MFPNTISITWAGAPGVTLTRVNQDAYSSEYRAKKDDGASFVMSIRHSKYIDKTRAGVSVDRHNVELVYTKPNADLPGGLLRTKAYSVFEADTVVSAGEPGWAVQSISDFLDGDNIARLLMWES